MIRPLYAPLMIALLLLLAPTTRAEGTDLYGLCMGLRSGGTLKPETKALLKGKVLDQELDTALKDANRLRDAACVVSETKRSIHLGALLRIPNEQLVPEVFSAIIRIASPGNEEQIRNAMKERIRSPNREDQILQTLGALQVLGAVQWKPTVKEMEAMLESNIPEVRMGSHDFLFQRFEQLSATDRKTLISAALKKDPLQVRVSALRTYRGLKEQDKKALQIDLSNCKKDPEPEVREECP